MSYPSAKGGGGTPPRDDLEDPFVPYADAPAVSEDHGPLGTKMIDDHNAAFVPSPDGEECVHDDPNDPEVELSHIPRTAEKVFEEDPSVREEEIKVQMIAEDNLASCAVSQGIEERMVEEEDVLLEGENEHEAPVPIGLCGEDEVPEMSEYKKLREQNIKEREEMMKEVMEEINEAKQEMYDNAHKKKKVDNQDKPKSKRRRMKQAEVIR